MTPLAHTVPEVAELLRISQSQAYRLIESGDIPHRRFGRRIIVPRQAVLDLLGLAESSSATPAPSPGLPPAGVDGAGIGADGSEPTPRGETASPGEHRGRPLPPGAPLGSTPERDDTPAFRARAAGASS